MKTFTSFNESLEAIRRRIELSENLPEENPDARCPLCDGYGNLIDENGARPCSCIRQEIIRTGISEARIPTRFTEETLASFIPHKISLKNCLQKAQEYVDGYSLKNPKGLYISGNTGVGKTHLAVGILKALIERGFDGVFYNVVDLLDNIRATFDPQNSTEPKSRLVRDMERQIFVLDDFGVQKTSSWVADRLYALINRRYQDCKTIILTSNFELKDLLLKVDKPLSSRIIDMCEEIEIKADDYRQHRKYGMHSGSGKGTFSDRSH